MVVNNRITGLNNRTMCGYVYNTRIAPSPTGMFHLGTARTAYFNYLAARATNGLFLLRIDDTDQLRHNEKAIDIIYDTLSWLGIENDYSFRQSNQDYTPFLDKLSGLTYLEDNALKIKFDKSIIPCWTDIVSNITYSLQDKDIEIINGMVLLKSDGTPTYHFASVCDDIRSRINLIIRGTDHINNTMRQAYLFQALGATIPEFAHIGLLFKDGKKLSKRDGAASVLDWRDKGIYPEAMLNSLLKLGWGPTDPEFDHKYRTVSKEQAIELFLKEGSMRNIKCNFDPAKLEKYNRQYKAKENK